MAWLQNYGAAEDFEKYILRADEALDILFLSDLLRGELYTRKLSDGTDYTKTTFLGPPGNDFVPQNSVLSKYFIILVNNAGVPNLKIYKDGALKQTIDLSVAPISWTSVTSGDYRYSLMQNGKYIFIENSAVGQVALFKGS